MAARRSGGIDVSIDDTDLRKLEVDLSGARLRIQFGVTRNIGRGARLVEREMKIDATNARRHSPSRIKHLPKSTSWEMLDAFSAEIGLAPKTRTQGALAHILAYGTSTRPPIYDHTAGLRRATPRIERMLLEDAADDVLGAEK